MYKGVLAWQTLGFLMTNPNSDSTAEFPIILIRLSLSKTRIQTYLKNITDRSGSVEVRLQEKRKLAPRENSLLKKSVARRGNWVRVLESNDKPSFSIGGNPIFCLDPPFWLFVRVLREKGMHV